MEDWAGKKPTFVLMDQKTNIEKSKMTTYIKKVDIKFEDH